MVTWKVPVAELPRVSDAVQVTVFVPIGKTEPGEGVQLVGRVPSTVSLAVAEKSTAAPAPLVASRVIVAGRLKEGAVVSRTVTVKDPLAWFPWASVAVHVTVVEAIANVEPLDGTHEGVIGPSTVSLAEAENVTEAPLGPVASAVGGDGRERVGGVASRTVIVKLVDPS
jgi:hypothetical protein